MARSSITGIKQRARRAIHGAFCVEAQYDFAGAAAVPVTVRWHNRIDRFGDSYGAGYTEVIEGVERLIFSREELEAKGLMLQRGGTITITEEGWGQPVLRLGSREPSVGPAEEIWGVGA